MFKWIASIFAVIALVLAAYWFSINKHVRYLILNQPSSENPLFWTTKQRDAAFQSIELLNVMPHNVISKGDQLPALEQGSAMTFPEPLLDQYFADLRISSLVVLHQGKLVFERYALGFDETGKWTSFSVAKSFASTLVGAAIKDGYITSLDDKVTDYIADMRGSAYDDVTIQQLLTMTSGVAWNEDYDDPNSDVNRFNYHQAESGMDVTASYMKRLGRAHEPGAHWQYSTGETNLIGLLVSQATGIPLHQYLSEKIWSKIGVEQDASWLIGSTGHEISGCCIQASTRDFALFGQFILEGAMVNNQSIVPDGWFDLAVTNQVQFEDGQSGYGFQWWTSEKGSFAGRGIFGQGIYIDPNLDLVIAVNANWPKASAKQYSQKRDTLYAYISQVFRNDTHP
jgi:CubicO group peptidase (beta-lactamase class C family)